MGQVALADHLVCHVSIVGYLRWHHLLAFRLLCDRHRQPLRLLVHEAFGGDAVGAWLWFSVLRRTERQRQIVVVQKQWLLLVFKIVLFLL